MSNITNVRFRVKQPNWKNYSVSYEYEDGQSMLISSAKDSYLRAFLSDYILRPSCYHCRFKGVHITSDIVIGDFWGIEKSLPGFDDEAGVSVLIANTKKGLNLVELCTSSIAYEEVDFKDVRQKALVSSFPSPKDRNDFFKMLQTESLSDTVDKFLVQKKPKYPNIMTAFFKNLFYKKVKMRTGNYTNVSYKNGADCCGCESCSQACPVNAIEMKQDAEGFRYPNVDTTICINCSACIRSCPIEKNTTVTDSDMRAFACKAKEKSIQLASSSGGMFSVLAGKVLENGGIVFGVTFDYEQGKGLTAKHIGIDRNDELFKLQGSKYVQSQVGNAYLEAKEQLLKDRMVLFSGTPCQVAGLQAFLEKDYSNLITVSVICHGVPSPLIFDRQIFEMENIDNQQ